MNHNIVGNFKCDGLKIIWIGQSAGKHCVVLNSYKLEILKLLVYNKPFGMSRKYNKLHSEPSETIMEYLLC